MASRFESKISLIEGHRNKNIGPIMCMERAQSRRIFQMESDKELEKSTETDSTISPSELRASQEAYLQRLYGRKGKPVPTVEEFQAMIQRSIDKSEKKLAELEEKYAKEEAEKEQLKKEKARARRKKA